jgi:hypothetical protein
MSVRAFFDKTSEVAEDFRNHADVDGDTYVFMKRGEDDSGKPKKPTCCTVGCDELRPYGEQHCALHRDSAPQDELDMAA